jgi:hypothetical protein
MKLQIAIPLCRLLIFKCSICAEFLRQKLSLSTYGLFVSDGCNKFDLLQLYSLLLSTPISQTTSDKLLSFGALLFLPAWCENLS